MAKRAYCNQPPWKRIVVILAGPGMNFLIAFAIFWAILASSNYNGDVTLGNINSSIQTLVPASTVQETEKGSPAQGVLRHGDRILAVDGQSATVASAMHAIASHRCAGALSADCRAATPVQLTVRRAGRVLTLSVYPRYSTAAQRMLVGFDFGATPKQFGAFAAAGVAAHEMWSATGNLITGIGRAYTSSKARHEVHTIVGIGEIAHEAVADGAGYGLVILGLISLILAVVNLFPFLPLDGGHVAWALAEKVRGPADLGRRDVALQHSRHRAVRVPVHQRPVQRHRPPGGLTPRSGPCGSSRPPRSFAPAAPVCPRRRSIRRMHAHPALDKPAGALGQRRAEQRFHLAAAQQLDLLPLARGAQPPVGTAQRHREPMRERQQRMWLQGKRVGGGSARTSRVPPGALPWRMPHGAAAARAR